MTHAVSRRNEKAGARRRAAALLLSASLCLFAGGAGSFAWACGYAHDIQSRQDAGTRGAARESPPTGGQQTVQENESSVEDTLRGVIQPGLLEEGRQAEAEDGGERSPEGDAETATGESAAPKTGGGTPAPATRAGTREKRAAARTRTVRHTAYKRTPVYRTERHEAAVAVQRDDGSGVTWTLCPTCGKHHAEGFDTRVIDHYDEVLCKACGGKHAKAYTEKVRVG